MKNDKLLFAVGMLAIAAVLYSGYYAWLNKQAAITAAQDAAEMKTRSEESGTTRVTESLPAATGNIEDLTAATETELNNQQAVLTELEAEGDAVTSDNDAISGFGQVYSENDY